MSATEPPPVKQALTLLQQNQPPAEAMALLAQIGEADPDFAKAQHLRGVCAARSGDPKGAVALYIDAIGRGELTSSACLNLAQAAVTAGMPDEALATLLGVLTRLAPQQAGAFAFEILKALRFSDRVANPGKAAVFDKLFLPFLATVLARRQMDLAIQLESVAYEWYAKATETEAHFSAVMGRIEPLFTEAAHALRPTLPAVSPPPLEPPYRMGFFIHNATMLAHIEVLLNTLKGYRALDDQPFEPTVYCFSGKSLEMERALAGLGVRLVMLNERFPETAQSSWARLLSLREILAQDGVQELVWISLVTMMPLAFGLRMAPVQTWFAMKYRNFSQPDIDGYLTGSALTSYRTVAGRRFRMHQLGVDDWYDQTLSEQAAQIRAGLGDAVVLITMGRTEKMSDPAYLAAMVEILRANPQAVFLWAGREEASWVTDAFRAAGVLDRTRFIGWVNTRLYAQVGDIFLDTFPFPCGFTLFQSMAAGKPVVLYDSPEAAQTGLWNFIKPLVEATEGTPAERAELRALVGPDEAPLIATARGPDDYVRLASRLIRDAGLRAEAGRAAQAFMARYFSDPRMMGRSVSDHLVELIELKKAS